MAISSNLSNPGSHKPTINSRNDLGITDEASVTNHQVELSILNNNQRRELTELKVETDLKQKIGTTYTGKTEDEQACREIPTSVKDSDPFPPGAYRRISEASLIWESQRTLEGNSERNINVDCKRKWVILTAAFLALFICTGFPFNMAVLNIAFLEAFGKSNAETSLVQAVTVGMFFVAGLPVGAIVSKYGVRKVGICGSILAAVGLVLSFFATCIPYLVVTTGVIAGAGLSACYISAMTGVGEYFEGKSKLEALSFLSFGTGCGATTYVYLLDFLTREFGWRGCLLIVGGITLNMVPCFAVCKPRTVDVSGLNKSDTNARETISVSTISSGSALYSKEEAGTCSKLVTVCQNKVYVIYTLALVIAVPTITSISIFLISFLQFKGFDPQTAVFLYAVMTFFSAIFRLVPGFLKRIPHLSIMVIPVIFTIVGTITCAFIPGAITFEHHIILMGFLGISIGGTVTVIGISTMKLVGMKNYSIGLGVTISGVGIGNSCGGPIAGYLRDTTGSYELSFYVAAVGLGVASCLNIVAAAIRKYNANVSMRPEEYLKNRRGSRRRSSILPWKGKVEFIF